MTGPRQEVAAKLKADNPTFIVHEYPVSAPPSIPTGKVFINVYRERFQVADNNGYITHYLKVSVAIPKQNSDVAENELDAAVDAVLLSIQAMPDVYWQDATRDILGGKFEFYEITLQAIRPHIYKSQILTSA